MRVIFDSDSQKARDALSTLGLSDVLVASNMEEFARLSSGDLIAIATTSPTHLELIRLVAESGSSKIVCEKPIGRYLRKLVNKKEDSLSIKAFLSLVLYEIFPKKPFLSISTIRRSIDAGKLRAQDNV